MVAGHGGGGRRVISFLQFEFLSQLRGYLVGEFLRISRMFRRSYDGRSPAEDWISADRYEHSADQQLLKNHFFELGVCFCFFSTVSCSVANLILTLKSDDFAEEKDYFEPRAPPVPVGNLIWLAVDRESGDAVVQ